MSSRRESFSVSSSEVQCDQWKKNEKRDDSHKMKKKIVKFLGLIVSNWCWNAISLCGNALRYEL